MTRLCCLARRVRNLAAKVSARSEGLQDGNSRRGFPTIAAFCSAVQTRRRAAPMKISSRCARSRGRETFDTSLRSEIDTCRSLHTPLLHAFSRRRRELSHCFRWTLGSSPNSPQFSRKISIAFFCHPHATHGFTHSTEGYAIVPPQSQPSWYSYLGGCTCTDCR